MFKSTNNSWRYERKCEWVFFLNTLYKLPIGQELVISFKVADKETDRHVD